MTLLIWSYIYFANLFIVLIYPHWSFRTYIAFRKIHLCVPSILLLLMMLPWKAKIEIKQKLSFKVESVSCCGLASSLMLLHQEQSPRTKNSLFHTIQYSSRTAFNTHQVEILCALGKQKAWIGFGLFCNHYDVWRTKTFKLLFQKYLWVTMPLFIMQ